MQYSNLEEAYGSPFHQATQVNRQRKDVKENFQAPKGIPFPISDDTGTVVPPPKKTQQTREAFFGGDKDNNVELNEKLNKILRLVELKGRSTSASEPASTHDLMLYIVTGVFFLFTLDSFVLLGKNSSN
jgi:hypothetical protein